MIQVIQIKEDLFVYPIFKNGSSSLKQYAKRNKCKMLFNEQVRRCETITTYIREPKERFIAGVHSYIAFERRKDPHGFDYYWLKADSVDSDNSINFCSSK